MVERERAEGLFGLGILSEKMKQGRAVFPPAAAPLTRSTTIDGKGKAGERAQNPSEIIASREQAKGARFSKKTRAA
ncbi:hypothetical protein [Desulfobulbus sp.]|uniref:hypothetical protein n=1 Tax=Desulfobulbus sp. TaxID=895 RepID=UPI00286F5AE0|nr:hypothetical protein [Desulfobulbus sp.]